jgi:PAS domain-containing protein
MIRISRQLEAKLALKFAMFLIAISVFIYFYLVTSFEEEALDKFRYKAKIFSNYLEQDPQVFVEGKFQDQSEIIKFINLNDAKYLLLEDSNGHKIETISTELEEGKIYIVAKPIDEISQDEQVVCISLPIIVDKQEIGKIYVGFYAIDTIAGLHKKKLLTALISLSLLLSGIIITFLLATFSFKPLSRLNSILDRSIKEDKSIKIDYAGRDEIGVLTQKINSILTELDISSGRVDNLKRKLRGDFKEKIKELEHEINQRKHVEISLQTSEEQFRLLFENAPIGMVIISPDMKIKSVNKSFSNTLGYEVN